MPDPACPICTVDDALSHLTKWECSTCGYEWPKEAEPEAARIVKDAHGTVLAEGDDGSSQVLKGGAKAKNIRLVDGDHEIDCRVGGMAMALKACFVKKA
jgi:protein PhnA